MMPKIEYTSLKVMGPANRSIANRFQKQVGTTQVLAVLFPGLNYTCDHPLLYYISRLAIERSMDVLQLWANYTKPDFQNLSKLDQVRQLFEDAQALIEAGQKQRQYTGLVLVGKSIGTMTLAALFENVKELAETPAIWLTPLFHQSFVLNSALSAQGRALFIAGSADPTYDAGAMRQVEDLKTAQTVIITGADHGLEIPGDTPASLEALKKVATAAGIFLDDVISG